MGKAAAMMAVVGMVALGCGGRSSEQVREGQVDVNDPMAVMGELGRLGEQAEQLARDLENAEPITPVAFGDLVAWLPAPPSGWEADEPTGSSTTMGEWSVSQAERRYTQGEMTIRISVMDSTANPSLMLPITMASAFKQESTTGFERGITLGSHVGVEKYDRPSQSGSLMVLVNRRFVVDIQGQGIGETQLREWWDRLDIEGLAAKS
ncbi:MAG: hypothetical protein Q6K70_10605 [Thermostichales cyanobacterium DRC_bins_46]